MRINASARNECLIRKDFGILPLALLVIMCLVLFSSQGLLGQEQTSSIEGIVKDSSGAVLPGATITATNKATNRVITTQSSGSGLYVLRNLEPGRYAVAGELKGFSKYQLPDVIMLLGKTLKIDMNLQVGTLEQAVQISDNPPMIDTQSTTVAHNVSSEEFDRLPKGRSFQGLVLTSPSVNSGQIEGGFQVNGSSGAENSFTIDGISTASGINGRSRQDAIFDILQEVQVKTAGIEAEYGGALGGVISAVTKSGGNAFHGDAHFYYGGAPVSAGPVSRLVLDPVNTNNPPPGYYVQDNKGDNNGYEVGGSLGGYLIKNKLYFFLASSPRWQRRTIPYLTSNGTVPDSFSQDQFYMQSFAKISYDPTSRISTNFAWLYTPIYSTGRLPANNGSYGNGITSTSKALAPNKVQGFYSPQSSYTGNLNFTLDPTSLLSIRGGYFWDDYHATGIPNISAVEYQTSNIGTPFESEIPPGQVGGIGYTNTPRVQGADHDLVTRTYVNLDYSKAFTGWGSHNLKAGVGDQKTVNNVDTTYPGGGYVYVFWNRSFTSRNTGITDRGKYGYYESDDFGTRGTTGASVISLYVQDQWRVSPRVVLSLGIRTENEGLPSFNRAIKEYAFKFGFGSKMSPRLGINFDVFGNGKMKVFGSWGRLYDWTKYQLARASYGGDIWHIQYRSLDTTDVFSLGNGNLPGRNLWNSVPGSYRDRRVIDFEGVDPGIKPMSEDQFNAGLEWELRPNLVFSGHYIHSKLNQTIEDIGTIKNGDETYIEGNPGIGQAAITPTFGSATAPFPTPLPIRTYDAMELSLTRRFGNGWLASASYVYSRLYGNYSGLANSDEIRPPTLGFSSPVAQQLGGDVSREGANNHRAYDLYDLFWDSHGTLDVKGRLATDRPHVFKLYGSYQFKFGLQFGGFYYGGSGTPISTYMWENNTIPLFVNGRGDLGRTPFLNQTDFLIAQEFKLGEQKTLRFEFNAINVFNQKTNRYTFPDYNYQNRASSQPSMDSTNLANGYNYQDLVAKTTDGLTGRALDPRYGMAAIFNPGFTGRIGVKFTF